MTQSDSRPFKRCRQNGHMTGYDPDWNGPASGPGGKPKGKKLRKTEKNWCI
jgi:hypothetical protein